MSGVALSLLAAQQLGLKVKLVRTDLSRLPQTPLPAMAVNRDGRFFILARSDGDQMLIQDPQVERPQVLSTFEFNARWDRELILFTSRASLAGELAKFDFTWFIPAVVEYLPERGRVLVDGIDLAMADSGSLRRQIGVVLQEYMLFNRSIRDNIALSDPGLPIEALMAAAKLASARASPSPGR